MPKEIEKKYLPSNSDWKSQVISSHKIIQGYLNESSDGANINPLTIRVRILDNEAYLTIKSRSSDNGLSRDEYEYLIPYDHGIALLQTTDLKVEKTRHLVNIGSHTFEVDEFEGANAGLIVAEVELSSVNEEHPIPDWLGREVTSENKYSNASLSKKPFSQWATGNVNIKI